jgi:hypothetical protein
MLGRQVVVHGDHHGVSAPADGAQRIVCFEITDHPAAAVKEDDAGKRAPRPRACKCGQ